ncbi:hypothetical protein [Helicobacter sp. T3_23-1056]
MQHTPPQNPNNQPNPNENLTSTPATPASNIPQTILVQDFINPAKSLSNIANPQSNSLKSIFDSAVLPPAMSANDSTQKATTPAQNAKSEIRIIEGESLRKDFGNEVRINQNERDELFAIEAIPKDEGLNVRYLIYAYLGLGTLLLICMPKIWLSSAIYYTSRDINKLQTQRDLLQEENKRLQNEREKLKYQYLKLNSQPQNPR